MTHSELINAYAAGPGQLRRAIDGMSSEEIDAAPIPGKWSTRQIICHLADFDSVYADRIKRVIAEEDPSLAGGFRGAFAERLAYSVRDIEEEISLIELTRRQMVRILRTVPPETFERAGVHSTEGRMTLRTLLQRIAGHIAHHVQFIEEKRRALEST